MATASTSLVSYDSDSSSEEESTKGVPDESETMRESVVDITALKSKILLNSAPTVTVKVTMKVRTYK